MKMIMFDKCQDCPHYDLDPQTVNSMFWGQHCCIKEWDMTAATEDKILLVEPDSTHPDCTLPDIKPDCSTCYWLSNIPDIKDPCYSCNDYDKWKRKC